MAQKDKADAIEKVQPAETAAVVERDHADASTYRILNRSKEEVVKALSVFQHNLRGQPITERDLPRVKVPPRGSPSGASSPPKATCTLKN